MKNIFFRELGIPFSFTLGAGEVIQGWERGIAQMAAGQRASLTLRRQTRISYASAISSKESLKKKVFQALTLLAQ